jgi:hypothetical protein
MGCSRKSRLRGISNAYSRRKDELVLAVMMKGKARGEDGGELFKFPQKEER